LVTNAVYVWDFGDGTGTNIANPVHGYANPGWYTVSLQLTQTNPPKSSPMIKTNYIFVVDVPPTVLITNPAANAIVRSGDPITLQSSAVSIDDVVTNVQYFLVSPQQTNFLGSVTNPPYNLVFPTTNSQVSTNDVFMALAQDSHGAASWSPPLTVNVVNLTGDILILSISNSPEIQEMQADLSQLQITEFDANGNPLGQRGAIVDTLTHNGLYFALVGGFKLIVWDDQGQINPGLNDTDATVLLQAYAAGIPSES
jgi:hypothetical protein